jgi:ABC-type amino acid transport substrate-binding protein
VAEAEWLASQKLTLLIYRTDEQQRVLRADGLQLADSLEQAVVAQVGATKDDAGSTQLASSSVDVRLDPGQELRVMLRDATSTTVIAPAWKVDASGNVISLNLGSSPLSIHASLTEANRVDLQIDLAHSSGLGELLFFEQQDKVDVQFLSSCANTNTLAFVKVDVSLDSVSGTTQLSVAGRPFSNTDAFRDHLLQHLEPDFHVSQGGGSNQSSNHVWTVVSTGYYTTIMISQRGDVFSLGSQLNRDGRVHLQWIGDGVYAFEDLSADQGSDFDYNDALLVIKPRLSSALTSISDDASGASAVDSNVAPAALLRSLPQPILTSDAAPIALQLPDSDAVAGASTLEQQDGGNENQRLQSQGVLNVALASDGPGVSQSDDITLFSTTFNPLLQNPLQVTQPEEIPGGFEISGDVVDAIITRGELRVAVARAAEDPADLLAWQRDLLTAVATSLGSSSIPLQLTLTSYASASEALEQLTSGMVDLVLPDDNDATWLDGVVGVDSLPLAPANSAVLLVSRSSGISSFEDPAGSRLGLIGNARVRAAMSLNLSRHDAQATILHFPDLEQARHALQAGQLDGLVLMQDSVSAVESWLESNGFDSQLLQDQLLASMGYLYLAPNQSRLRDVLLAAKVKMQLENS